MVEYSKKLMILDAASKGEYCYLFLFEFEN